MTAEEMRDWIVQEAAPLDEQIAKLEAWRDEARVEERMAVMANERGKLDAAARYGRRAMLRELIAACNTTEASYTDREEWLRTWEALL